ncbi:hypothetical protein BB560_006958, partial [Smittium megazygosporum]
MNAAKSFSRFCSPRLFSRFGNPLYHSSCTFSTKAHGSLPQLSQNLAKASNLKLFQINPNFSTRLFSSNPNDPKSPNPSSSSGQNEPADSDSPKSAQTNSKSSDSSFASSNLASKILSEKTGIPNEQQTAQKGQDQDQGQQPSDEDQLKDFEKLSPAERRRARRNRATLDRKDTGKSKSTRFIIYGLLTAFVLAGISEVSKPYDSEEKEKGFADDENDNAFVQAVKRIYHRSVDTKKLLPDKEPNQSPYTLVVSLDDLLVETSWDKQHGWRIGKRPHVDAFLAYMCSMFELVIFSDQPSYSAETILGLLDPFGYAPLRLYKEHLRHVDGKNIKDLTFLNRDLSKVIILDTDPKNFVTPEENAIAAPKFKGDPKDTWLLKSVPFFEYLYMMETDDVRQLLAKFGNYDTMENYE